MIVDIEYKNYRVFKNPVLFSLEASEAVEKGNNVAYAKLNDSNIRLLNISTLYGPNASGKTTLIFALYYLRKWVRNNNVEECVGWLNSPFRLDTYSYNNPSEISIRLIQGNELFRYKAAFISDYCCHESLCQILDDREIELFTRIIPGNPKESHSLHYGAYFDKAADLIAPVSVSYNSSALSVFSNFHIEPISNIAEFISRIGIGNSYNLTMHNEMFMEVKPWLKETKNKLRLVKFLNLFDINLAGLKIPQKPDSPVTDIIYLHNIKSDDEQNKIKEFKSYLESTGTKTLVTLGAKILESLDNGMPLFIDELDSGFHTEVTRTIIEMFQDKEINRHNAQLIITTHDVNQMDETLLRKDQIWFIEKNQDGESELYSLAEFEDVAEDTDFSGWYLARKFGAVPRPSIAIARDLFK